MAAGNRARNRYLRSVESLRRRTGCGDRLWFDVWQYGQMAEKIARELAVQGVKNIIVYNLSYADISNVIRDIFKYDTLIVGSPTYNGELFPEVGPCCKKSANVAFPAGNSPISAPIPGLEQRYACWENSPRNEMGGHLPADRNETGIRRSGGTMLHGTCQSHCRKNPVENPDSSAINRDGAVIGTVPV